MSADKRHKDGTIIHDGYLFTLGISGTPRGERPAARLLLAMIEALPPVKRVAALGDDAALHALVLEDLCAAELLLLVTPAQAGGLPPRVLALLEYCAAAAGAGLLRGKVAALATVGAPDDGALALAGLRRFCVSAGIDPLVVAHYPLIVDRAAITAAQAAARRAFRFAEARLPTPSLSQLSQ